MVSVNISNIPDLSATDAVDLTRAEIDGRRQAFEYLRAFRDALPGFERTEIASLATQVGIRETRRVRGEYRLHEDEVLKGKKFEDGIALGAWPVELHDPETGKIRWGYLDEEDDYYSIPFGCLIPLGIDNLLVAGRCLSATHVAHASARVMAQAFAMGEAAGVGAAESANSKTLPRMISPARIRDELIRRGAMIEA